MHTYGLLEVHDNVVFEANTAGLNGGAVNFPRLFFIALKPRVE